MSRSRRSQQLSFLSPISMEHGGSLRAGKRKIARPFSSKRPIHLVLRSKKARGNWSLLHPKNAKLIERIIEKTSKTYAVKVYRKANVGNHLHLIVRAKTKRGFQGFLRVVSGQIAFRVTGAKKTKPLSRADAGRTLRPLPQRIGGAHPLARIEDAQQSASTQARGFWDGLIYSRVLLSWGKDFTLLKDYLTKNLFEAGGYWNRKLEPWRQLIVLEKDGTVRAGPRSFHRARGLQT